MNLDRVTITGADDSITPGALFSLSSRFPFVEWGILFSRAHTGGPRFPSISWINALQTEVRRRAVPMKLSLHLCGNVVRQLLLGNDELTASMRDEFDRVQLNFHAERTPCAPDDFYRALHDFGGHRQFIFQLDGALGNKHLQSVLLLNEANKVDAVPLYDISGGAGVLPESWPKPIPGLYMGYAGGLGPDNLAEQLPLIAAAAGDARFWIDMETRVRSNSNQQFDLEKVEECLTICSPFVESACGGIHG